MAKKLPPLGETQKAFLKALVRHGSWETGPCGWTWSNRSETQRLAESLCKRGYAMRSVIGPTNGFAYEYRPTQLGIDKSGVTLDPYGRRQKKAAREDLPAKTPLERWLETSEENRKRVASELLSVAKEDGWPIDMCCAAWAARDLLLEIAKRETA